MIYGFLKDETQTVIAAATSLDELVSFIQNISTELPLCVSAEFASFEDIILDPVFSKLKRTPLIVTHADSTQRDAFIQEFQVNLLSPAMVIKRVDAMMDAHEVEKSQQDDRTLGEIYGSFDPKETMTDEQKAEADYQDALNKEQYDKAAREGTLSEEKDHSADDDDLGSVVTVAKVEVNVGPDGKVRAAAVVHKRERTAFDGSAEFDPKNFNGSDYKFAAVTCAQDGAVVVRIFARPAKVERLDMTTSVMNSLDDYFTELGAVVDSSGEYSFFNSPNEAFIRTFLSNVGFVFDERLQGVLEARYERIAEPDEAVRLDEDGNNIAIANDDLVEMYFKVSVAGHKLAEVRQAIIDAGAPYDKLVIKARDDNSGCWMACVLERFAHRIGGILKDAGITCGVSKVDPSGEATSDDLMTDIFSATGTKANENKIGVDRLIRPWTERRAEWDALSAEQKEESRKSWTGDEFYLCVTDLSGSKCLVTFVPRAWFDKHGTKFEENYDISHLFPEALSLKPFEQYGKVLPWSFTSTLQSAGIARMLCNKLKFVESLRFQMHLNTEGY